MKLTRTNSNNHHFVELVKKLDAYLALKDGDEHAFYNQFNKIDSLRFVVIAYENETAIGCGAIKKFESGVMEVKRMYVDPNFRGKRVGSEILKALEIWANELGCKKCVLETGKRQPEAIGLYEKCGYQRIPNYGQYIGMENSVCFEKNLV